MLRTVFRSTTPAFTWLDLVEPSRADLDEIARTYGLTASAVADCLDPEHLPKFERFNGTTFAILRAHDELAGPGADCVQSFTRKVAIFWAPEFFITIHRKDQSYLTAVMQRWEQRRGVPDETHPLWAILLADLTNGAVQTYEAPLVDAEMRVDTFEAQLLGTHDVAEVVRELYQVKRRVTLAKRLLWRTLTVVTHYPLPGERSGSLMQDLRENTESMHFYADELLEDVVNLLHMQLSLAAHRTNEVIQVLTVFSAFFLPLTFIVGVYGMNFQYMPELTQRRGYPAVWAVMALMCLGIAMWFRRRGWLK
jgi:magnesium transporter